MTLEVAREGILPGLNLIFELGGRDSESLGGDVDRLEAVVTGEENQRSGQVVDKERCEGASIPESFRVKAEIRTIVAVVDVHAVTVVKALEGARHIDMEVVVAGVLLVLDAREILEEVFVHVERERPWREPLVVDRRVERERLVHDVDDLLGGLMRLAGVHTRNRILGDLCHVQ